jgi:hypothetical protein
MAGVIRAMNVYITRLHRHPLLKGTTDADERLAAASGFEVDLLIHPGGIKEWAVCLRAGDDPTSLQGWAPFDTTVSELEHEQAPISGRSR